MQPVAPVPDIEAFEERAASRGVTRYRAEDEAAKAQGFRDAAHYWQVLADYVVKGR
jgi:hypothetical protein